MNSTIKSLFTFFVLLVTVAVQAQEIKINKGDLELNLSTALNQGEVSADVHFGAFVSDYMLWRVDVGYMDTEFLSTTQAGLSAIRFFETRTYTLPYIGLGAGYNSLEGMSGVETSGVEMSLILGLRYYMAENVALNTEVKTAWSSEETFIDGSQTTDTDYRLRIGLSYLW
jgi:hypothetical protein